MASQDRGQWLPLIEYAIQTGLSLSTLRRYIKSKRVQHQLIDGRYLVWMDPEQPIAARTYRKKDLRVETDREALAAKVVELDNALQKAREEISELQMLIEIYENSPSSGEMARLT